MSYCTCPEAGGVYDPTCPVHSPRPPTKRATPPPDTAVRLTARELAHAAMDAMKLPWHCDEVNAKRMLPVGNGHDEQCDRLTEAFGASSRALAAALRAFLARWDEVEADTFRVPYGDVALGAQAVLRRLDAPTSPPETPLYTRPVCAKPCRHGKPCVRPPHADDVICICDDEVGPVSREPG